MFTLVTQYFLDLIGFLTAANVPKNFGDNVGAVAKIGLFQNNITPTPATALGDLTEPTYTGYAQQSILNWGGVQTNPDGSVQTVCLNNFVFLPSDGVTPNTIYGAFVLDNALGLKGAVRFANPILFTGPTTGVALTIALQAAANGNGIAVAITAL